MYYSCDGSSTGFNSKLNLSHVFLTLKGYSFTSVFFAQSTICQFISLIFHVISDLFPCLPGRKTTPPPHPRKSWKSKNLSGDPSPSPLSYWHRAYLIIKIVLIINFIEFLFSFETIKYSELAFFTYFNLLAIFIKSYRRRCILIHSPTYYY